MKKRILLLGLIFLFLNIFITPAYAGYNGGLLNTTTEYNQNCSSNFNNVTDNNLDTYGTITNPTPSGLWPNFSFFEWKIAAQTINSYYINAQNYSGFKVQFYNSSSVLLAEYTPSATGYYNINVPNVTYIMIRNESSNAININEFNVYTSAYIQPSAPEQLTATAGNLQVNLTWNAVTGATGYNVERSTTSGGIYTSIATNVTSPNYIDTSVSNGTTYYYVVTAVNANGESAYSNEVSATPQAPLPSSPTNLVAIAGTGQVSLTWDAVTNATSYDVKRSTTSGGIYTTISTGLTSPNYNDTTVTNGTAYYYVVTAVNASRESGNSNEATATPQSPEPSSPTNLSVTTGTGQVNLTWMAVTGATGYNVKRATTAGGPYTSIAQNVSATTYTDTSVAAGSTYYYIVTALTSGRESANSNEASATLSAPTGDRLYVLLDINEQAQLSVTNNLTDNTLLTWTSSDPTVATVDANGKVTALKEGTCFINVANSDNTYTDYIPIKVMKGAANYRLALHLKAGESKRLWITDNASTVTWTSMDTSVASIDSTGKVTAVANGLCIIQGQLNGNTYLIYVRVNS